MIDELWNKWFLVLLPQSINKAEDNTFTLLAKCSVMNVFTGLIDM